jgi:glycolate oxidase
MAPSSAPSRGLPLDALRERLRAALGAELLVADDAGVARYARDDGAEGPFPPGLVVRPRERAQVAELVALCHELGVPLSPRGAGTGTVGGCLADHGGVVLDLAGLDRILDIDERSLLAEVEPGVINAALQDAAEARGLFYPPDPASWKQCSLGGNVATNAGGPRACKYGVTGNFVLGLDVVTGTGEPLRVGHRSIKGVTGYNLAGLLVGSEGTLAVTTACTLRLVPRPAAALTLLASFADEIDACAAVHRCQTGGVVPTALEFADRLCVRTLLDAGGLAVPVPDAARALLWIEIDGDAAGLDASIRRAAQHCRDAGALDVTLAEDPSTRARLWDVRRALSHTLRARWPRRSARTSRSRSRNCPRSPAPPASSAPATASTSPASATPATATSTSTFSTTPPPAPMSPSASTGPSPTCFASPSPSAAPSAASTASASASARSCRSSSPPRCARCSSSSSASGTRATS